MEQRLKGRPCSDWPILRFISCPVPNLDSITDAMLWLHTGVLHGCPLRGPTSSWLKQMQILIDTHWTEVGEPKVRRIDTAQGGDHPIGRPILSTNQKPWELSETKSPNKQHTWPGPCHYAHMWQRDNLFVLSGR